MTLSDETDTKFPTEKAVKTYVDGKEIDLSTKAVGVLPIANGGTGSETQNFVDLTTDQIVAGSKIMSNDLKVSGITVGVGGGDSESASYNTALGLNALVNNTGWGNTAIGRETLSMNENSNNTAVGYLALKQTLHGNSLVAVGSKALQSNTEGNVNTALGASSLGNNTMGSENTAVGGNALITNVLGSKNTAIGRLADVSSSNLSNATAIGYAAKVEASNTIQLGNSAVTDVKTSGTLTAGQVQYPNTHGIAGQVLSTTGTGSLTWITPSSVSSDDFVDLTTNQTINGIKSFGSNLLVNGITVGGSKGGLIGAEPRNTMLGFNATTGEFADESTAIGNRASASGPQSIAIGSNAQANQTQGISIGYYSSIESGYGFAIGSYSKSNAMYSVALGAFSKTEGNYAVALGYEAVASAENSIALGKNATVSTTNTIQLGNTAITDVKTSGKITTGAITLPNTDGTAGQVLSTNGSGEVNWVTTFSGSIVREVADEFTATASQTSFILTQTPSSNSKVKMYVNGIRLSNTAYSVSGNTLTYNPTNNGGYVLAAGDRIQMDFYY